MSTTPSPDGANELDVVNGVEVGSLADVQTDDPRQRQILDSIIDGTLDPSSLGFKEKRDLDIVLIQHVLQEGKIPAEENKVLTKKLATLKRTQNPWFNMDSPVDYAGSFVLFAVLCALFSLNWRKVVGMMSRNPSDAHWFSRGLVFINLVIWGSIYAVSVVISVLLSYGG